MSLTSDGLVFTLDEESGNLSGAEWKEKLEGNEIYNGIKKLHKGDATTDITNNKIGWLDESKHYARYTVNNVWLLGPTKIWTGWGARNTDTGSARWTDHANWGFGDKSDQGEGKAFELGNAYQVEDSQGNFNFDRPTYFHSVEFYLPMKKGADGTWLVDYDDRNSSIMVATQTFGASQIKSRAAKLTVDGVTPATPNSGEYLPSISEFDSNTYKFVKAVVRRYDGRKYDVDNPSEWSLIHSADKTFYEKEFAGTDGLKEIQSGNWIADDKALNDGLYFYGMQVIYKDGATEKELWVPSPLFSIANGAEFKPTCAPLQLVQVKNLEQMRKLIGWNNDTDQYDPEAEGAVPFISKAYASLDDADKALLRRYAGKYMTVRMEKEANFYIVDQLGRAELLSVDDRARMQKLLSTPQFAPFMTWTSNYWVAAFIADNYKGTMASMLSTGALKSYTPFDRLEVTVQRLGGNEAGDGTSDPEGNDGNTVITDANRAEGKLIYGAIIRNGGRLDAAKYKSTLKYEYVTAEGEKHNVESTATSAEVMPMLPAAVIESYHYVADADPVSLYNPDGTPKDPTLVENDPYKDMEEITLKVKPQFEGIEELQDLTVKKTDAANRNLACEVRFYRPNVSRNILENSADIFMNINLMHVNDKGELIDHDGNVVSEAAPVAEKLYINRNANTDYTTDNGPVFTIKLENLSPQNDRNPRFNIADLRYVKNDGKYSDESAKFGNPIFDGTLYDYAKWPDYINCPSFVQKMEMGPNDLAVELQFSGFQNPATQEGANFYIYDISIEDKGDYLGNEPAGGVSEGDQNIHPRFYHIEAYSDATGKQEYYSVPEVFVYQPTKYHYSVKNAPVGDAPQELHPFLGKWETVDGESQLVGATNVIQGFEWKKGSDKELWRQIQLRVTPVYFFVHYPGMITALTQSGGEINLEPAEKAPARSPKRITVNPSDVADREVIVVHGGSATKSLRDMDVETGVEGPVADVEDVEPVYFTTSGVRVASPQPGEVYIVRRGEKVSKEICR